MKIKEGFFLRTIGEEAVVVPVGQRVVDFNGLISLNDTGKFIWECLKEDSTEESLVTALMEEYDVDIEQARQDVSAYIEELQRLSVIE
ncbi:MAG: PqqD family protein [Armatimonadota bacterium]